MPSETKKCPHCDAELDHLAFESDVTNYGVEWGTCDLDGDNFDWQDSETHDGQTDETRYKCPECDVELNPDDLIDVDEEDDDEPEVKQPPAIEGDATDPAIESNSYGTSVTIATCPQCGASRDTDHGEQYIICHRCEHEFPLATNKQDY